MTLGTDAYYQSPHFRVFREEVESSALKLFQQAAESGDDQHTQHVLFTEAIALVFEGLVRSLARERGLYASDRIHGQTVGCYQDNRQDRAGAALSWLAETRRQPILIQRLSQDELAESLDNDLDRIVQAAFRDAALPIECVGMVFEEMYGKGPPRSLESGSELATTNGRRDNGVYFTPPKVVKYLTELTLQPVMSRIEDPQELLNLRLVDPALGTGFFLLESLRLLSARLLDLTKGNKELSAPEARRLVAKHCLYGVDADPVATEISKALVSIEVGCPDFAPSLLDDHIKCGDSILGLPLERLEREYCRAAVDRSGVSPKFTRLNDVRSAKHELEAFHLEYIRQILPCQRKFSSPRQLSFRPFCWELSFPEVFLGEDGRPRKNGGFDVVLSNPPWGKIKPDLKEFHAHLDQRVSQYQGVALRRYLNDDRVSAEGKFIRGTWEEYSAQVKNYSNLLRDIRVYHAQRLNKDQRSTGGDSELYKYFMERAFQIAGSYGRIGLIVPAGFHRAEGSAGIRRLYFENGSFEHFMELENRKRLFPIHGMFKFLVSVYERGKRKGIRSSRFGLTSLSAKEAESPSRSKPTGIRLSLPYLKRVSGDLLTVPELRSTDERRIFEKVHAAHPSLGDTSVTAWNVHFVRELDMTNDSRAFLERSYLLEMNCSRTTRGSWISPDNEEYLPLFEGRMVHQFDPAAKAYKGGQGRTARWIPLAWTEKKLVPHYFVAESYAAKVKNNYLLPRAGFCDVTGHANERTVLAALVPGKSVCGNKVPTCQFDVDKPLLHLIWIAIANSFVLDWIVRRRISTTLNFFHWRQVPFPRVDPSSDIGRELAFMAAELCYHPSFSSGFMRWLERSDLPTHVLPRGMITLRKRADLRARIDAIVADLYGLTIEEFAVVLSDFPLLDRRQPALLLREDDGHKGNNVGNERQSTVTRDKVLLESLRRRGESLYTDIRELGIDIGGITNLQSRVYLAEQLGAIAYVPSEAVTTTLRP